jgi:hypothetical protein
MQSARGMLPDHTKDCCRVATKEYGNSLAK